MAHFILSLLLLTFFTFTFSSSDLQREMTTFKFGDYVCLKCELASPCTLNVSDYLTVIATRFANGQEIVTVGMNVGYARQLHKFSISSSFLQLDLDVRPYGCDKYRIFPGTTIAYEEKLAVVLWSNEKVSGIMFENEDICQAPNSTILESKVSLVWSNSVREGDIVRPIRNLQRVFSLESNVSRMMEQHVSATSWSLGVVSQKTRFRGIQGEWGWGYVIEPVSHEPTKTILLPSEYFMISFY